MTKARNLASASIVPAAVSVTELGYIDGVTSAIQTQMDTKAATAATINPTIVDAKGDLIAATADNAVSRLAVGANNTVLTADSAAATGMKWAAAAAGGANYSLLNAGGTALTGTTTTVSGISGKNKIVVLVKDASSNSATGSRISVRLNADAGGNYALFAAINAYTTTNDGGNVSSFAELTQNEIDLARMSYSVASQVSGGVTFDGCNSSGVKTFISSGSGNSGGSQYQQGFITQGYYNSATVISSISVCCLDTGSFDAGTVYVYTTA